MNTHEPRHNPLWVICIFLVAFASLRPLHVAAAPPDVCNAVIERDARPSLEAVARPGLEHVAPISADRDEIYEQLRAKNRLMFFNYVEDAYRIDIDNDGKEENVAIVLAGSAKAVGHVVYDDSWLEQRYQWVGFNDSDEQIRWAEFGYFVRFNNKIYLVWVDSSVRARLSHVSVYEGKTHRFLCKIGYAVPPSTTIGSARDDALCRAVLTGRVKYASFGRPSPLRSACHPSGGPECAQPLGSALLDIDNDGKRDVVVKMEVNWGGGAGCDFTFLAIVDPKVRELSKSDTNEVLMRSTRRWDVCGGATSTPFQWRGSWYVENKYGEHNISNFHNVIELHGAAVATVCVFMVHQKAFVVQ